MAITSTQLAGLNSMCKTANTYGLGTIIDTLESDVDALETAEAGVARGTVTADADEETAGSVAIATGLTAIVGFTVQVYRANILLADYDVQASGGTLTVATNSTDYVVTENDVINYIAY